MELKGGIWQSLEITTDGLNLARSVVTTQQKHQKTRKLDAGNVATKYTEIIVKRH